MGFKRPFDDEEFQGLPFKQARQVDYINKLTQFSETGAHCNVPKKPDEYDGYGSNIFKIQWHETFENDFNEVSNFAKDSDSSGPLSLVTSSSSDEDSGSWPAACSSFSSEYFEFPRKTSIPLADVCSSYLDEFPRKQVPLGPNHQASIPLWDRHMKKDKLSDSFNKNGSLLSESARNIYNDNEEKFVGTRIIPMPNTKPCLSTRYEAACGRIDCGCLDEGSVRCVRQHILEAREELLKSVGHEKFVNLGFYDMGEEVSCKWAKEEERVFHEVVYSRPVSLGQNFWKHLTQVFPDRTTKEIVSYYFNVFMLQKRAAQNRCNMLDIDSDDDEMPQINRGSYIQVLDEDEDSDLESPNADQGEDSLEDDIDDDSDDDSGDASDELGDGSRDTTGEDSGIDYASEALDMNSIDPDVKHMNYNAGHDGLDFIVQDDSCMSFEFQADKVDSPADTRAALHVNRSDHSKCLPCEVNGCGDGEDQVYLLDLCDAKDWDARYFSPIRGVDLLPTSNIIEEIFGQGTS
uniref:Myb-like domain-containing protein n=1 Tax=Salix viminalis TaxID=40686 RepID=A0A6N2LUA5_SALVM